MKKSIRGTAAALSLVLVLSLAACRFVRPGELTGGRSGSAAGSGEEMDLNVGDVDGTGWKIAMMTDTGGINDQSFNQSAWEGLKQLREDTGADVSYIESKQHSDFSNNLDNLIDNGNSLCWSIGFSTADATLETAALNPDVRFACVDNAFADTPANVTGVVFRGQESSFMVGYIAAAVSKTGRVGFVGGIANDVIAQFEHGYEGGVAYADRVLGKKVKVVAQYAESFTDAAKGKSIAKKMFTTDNCDVVYHAAGATGLGVIEAADEAGKFAIGVDRDQAYLAPDHVLTSSLKNVNVAVEAVSKRHIAGEEIGGKTLSFGLSDGAVGIPEDHSNYSDQIYQEALAVGERIKAGILIPPGTQEELKAFQKMLKKTSIEELTAAAGGTKDGQDTGSSK